MGAVSTIVVVGPLASASANNIVTSVTPTSGTALTLNGSLVTGGVAVMDKPRRVLLTFGNEGSARTLVVTGTNAWGNPIQETLVVPSGGAGTVASTQDFATVTNLLPLGGGWTAAATVGTTTIGGTVPVHMNPHFGPTDIEIQCTVTGTVTYQVEYTANPLNSNATTIGSQALGNYPSAPTWIVHATLNNKSANADGQINWPVVGIRTTITSGTGSVSTTILNAGIFNG